MGKFGEELELLVLLVGDDLGVCVVGEVGLPFDEGGVACSDGSEDDEALDAGGGVGGLG